MENRFRQIPLSQCELGMARVGAAISLKPEEVSKRYGIDFESIVDDVFGPGKAALMEEWATKKQFGFLRHVSAPVGTGTGIVIHERSKTGMQDIEHILSLLGLDRKYLNWIDPNIHLPLG